MCGAQQITYKGKLIFYMDFSHCSKAADIKKVISESLPFIRSQPPATVLTLSDITGMSFTQEIKDLFNEFIEGNKPFIKASAVTGLNGLQLIFNGLLRVTHRDINSFNSDTEAKEWLISQ